MKLKSIILTALLEGALLCVMSEIKATALGPSITDYKSLITFIKGSIRALPVNAQTLKQHSFLAMKDEDLMKLLLEPKQLTYDMLRGVLNELDQQSKEVINSIFPFDNIDEMLAIVQLLRQSGFNFHGFEPFVSVSGDLPVAVEVPAGENQ